MKRPAPRRARRRPQQRRAEQTVAAVLDAVGHLLRRHGSKGLTTNRIAERAGVSIGSLYQYFADKRAILVTLRDRHVEEMARLVERKLVARSTATLDELLRGLLEAMIDAHALDPALYALLLAQVPQHPKDDQDLERRVEGALRMALSAHAQELPAGAQIDRMLFVLTPMLESLAHAVALHRPRALSLAAATDEAVHAVLGYVHSPSS